MTFGAVVSNRKMRSAGGIACRLIHRITGLLARLTNWVLVWMRMFKTVKNSTDILIAPAGIASRLPVIIITRLTAVIHKRVDRAGPTKHTPAWMIN